MLQEIKCDVFKQKTISFNKGFNVVLGTETGDNSIGKSTFMLVIDFVFGGNTYSNVTEIVKNVGSHDIMFKFCFNEKPYCFIRNNVDSGYVWICNENYFKIEKISLQKYCDWLKDIYEVDIKFHTFRNAIGRFIRAYGKDNCDEKQPLKLFSNEKQIEAINSIVDLFGEYDIINEYEFTFNNCKDSLDALKKAQKYEYVKKINKTKYKTNTKLIDKLELEIDQLTKELDLGICESDIILSEEAFTIKEKITRIKHTRNRLRSKLNILNNNISYAFPKASNTYIELQKFFPSVELKKIEEVELFHKNIAKILSSDIRKEISFVKKELEECDNSIEILESRLQDLMVNPNVSKSVLKKHADSLRTIDQLKKENDAFEMLESKKNMLEEYEKNLEDVRERQFLLVEKTLNDSMELINNNIYLGKYNAPIIRFMNKTYKFYTTNDTGTGTAYKGLVVFDLAVANLTNLPILVHDSVLLKQISDEAIEKIIEEYINCGKQVIISLDKQNSYSDKTSDSLEKYAILKLAPNGQELYGRSWSKKEN